MSNELRVFSYGSNPVRTVMIDGDVWFAGKDVAEILGYSNPQEAVRTHVEEEDKGVSEILTPGGMQKLTMINESGLYSLILSSKLPTARKFKHWVTSEVLPTLIEGKKRKEKKEQMTSEVQVFSYRDKRVRTVERNGEIWFVAKDVCDALGIANSRDAVSTLDEDEISGVGITDVSQARHMNIISEAGLYKLIFNSRKPEAKEFTRWVTHDVLPTLRKTGSYDMGGHRKRMSDFDRAMKQGREVYTSLGLRGKKLAFALDKVYKDYLGFSALELAGIDPDEAVSDTEEKYLPEWKRRVMEYVRENGSVTAGELSRIAGIPRNTAGCHLRRMERQGYLRKVKHGVYVWTEGM